MPLIVKGLYASMIIFKNAFPQTPKIAHESLNSRANNQASADIFMAHDDDLMVCQNFCIFDLVQSSADSEGLAISLAEVGNALAQPCQKVG
jgi:hypothetical protein